MSILIVDDNQELLETFSAFLEKSGFKCYSATSAREAITRMVGVSDLQLVILDIGLGAQSGFDFLKFRNENIRFRQIPVLMCSGAGDSETVVQATREGASGFLLKPVRLADLLSRVNDAIRKGRRNILVVGQDDLLLNNLKGMAERAGFGVQRAGSIAAVLEHLSQYAFHCVVSAGVVDDQSNWIDLKSALVKANHHLPLLLLVQGSDTSQETAALVSGADGIISVPLNCVDLSLKLKRAIEVHYTT